MSYTALYRKYRPTVFNDVIGQTHITDTLTNQIKTDRIGHAYLFTGSRGTGKTTCAKIFARAVNCTDPKDGSPCGKCAVCKALEDAGSMDVLEIDAASNNKVDEVREIRERVKYPPVFGKYKVYIIDEVHMLTDSAFNALLKTLEEPPSHAVFILATTEVHKLPATILSRCMRFDFRLVPQDLLTAQVKKVYDAEAKQYEEEAVRYIAQAGEGSVRDSLSVADMCLARTSGTLTYADVLDVLGATDRGKIRGLFSAVADANIGKVLQEIAALAALGKSMNLIAKDLVGYARDLLAIKTGAEALVIDTPENVTKLRETSARYSVDLLVSVVQIFSSIDAELRYSVSPKIVLEAAALRACKLLSMDLNALEERLARLEHRIEQSTVLQTSAPMQQASAQSASVSAPATAQNTAAENDENKPGDARSVWGRITTFCRKNESMRLYSLVGSHKDVEIDNGVLTVWCDEGNTFLQFSDEETLAALRRALAADGSKLTLAVDKRTEAADMDSEIERLKKLMGKAPLNIKR